MRTKRNTSGENVVRIGAAVPESIVEALKKIADREDRSISSVIRRAVEAEIEKEAA